ncbi:unnamed protein product [Staurois parvus]|uniref:Uncharacterized protein n=1 Tax=Staurois parvus TaxID=386267 RepID=A0ABN9BQ69_9NEOB|nr:unnamed protein product [Staurois parvus]
MFDPDFSDSPLLPAPSYLSPDKPYGVKTLCPCSVWCGLFFLGECM